MKLCEMCGGSGNKFWMKDGGPHWEKCAPCGGTGVVVPFNDPTDDIELERWLDEFERQGGVRF